MCDNAGTSSSIKHMNQLRISIINDLGAKDIGIFIDLIIKKLWSIVSLHHTIIILANIMQLYDRMKCHSLNEPQPPSFTTKSNHPSTLLSLKCAPRVVSCSLMYLKIFFPDDIVYCASVIPLAPLRIKSPSPCSWQIRSHLSPKKVLFLLFQLSHPFLQLPLFFQHFQIPISNLLKNINFCSKCSNSRSDEEGSDACKETGAPWSGCSFCGKGSGWGQREGPLTMTYDGPRNFQVRKYEEKLVSC